MRVATVIVVGGLSGLAPTGSRQTLWQADLQVRDLSVSETAGSLTARFVVRSELGEAMAARVEVLLPIGVGLLNMSSGCSAGPHPSGISVLQGRVICTLGDLAPGASRALHVVTTEPPRGVVRGFGVVALSDTPDPRPANNFAERTIPKQ
jgi:hypothetical protein